MTATTPTASTWWVEVFLGEADGLSTATATLHTRDLHARDRSSLSTHGTARVDPNAHDGPAIGYEIATARALSELASRLLESASNDLAEPPGDATAGGRS